LICGMVSTGCGSKMAFNDNTDNIEFVSPTKIVYFDEVPPDRIPPYEVMFVNHSYFADSYLWDFGDGHTSTEREPKHTFEEAGIYCVTLTVFDKDMSPMSITKPVRVYSLSLISNDESSEHFANFEYILSSSCIPPEVMFINTSKNAFAFKWDFGDGVLSTQIDPSHTYMKSGTYNVRLIAYNEKMLSDTIIKPIVISRFFGEE